MAKDSDTKNKYVVQQVKFKNKKASILVLFHDVNEILC